MIERRSVATTLVVAIVMAVPLLQSGAAFGAQTWYSKSSPLIAWHDGKKHAAAYGASSKRSSTGHLVNDANARDLRPGGNKIFAETAYSWRMELAVWGTIWTDRMHKDQHTRTDSGKWVSDRRVQSYTDNWRAEMSDKGRVHSRVCVDRSWRPDWCSRWVFRTFNL